MKKKDIVKNNIYFNEIIKKGDKKQNHFFIIYSLNSEFSNPKFGFAVGKRIGKAVIRNKIKRQLRNIVTNNKNLFSLYKDYIIVAKKYSLNEKYDTLNNEMKNLIKKEKKDA